MVWARAGRFSIEKAILRVEPATKFAAGRIRERYADLLAKVVRQMGAEALSIARPGEHQDPLQP